MNKIKPIFVVDPILFHVWHTKVLGGGAWMPMWKKHMREKCFMSKENYARIELQGGYYGTSVHGPGAGTQYARGQELSTPSALWQEHGLTCQSLTAEAVS